MSYSQIQSLGSGPLEPVYAEAVAEEARPHDDALDACELQVAPRFTPEELDFSDYRWSRSDHRTAREIQMYESGMRYRDFF